MKNLSSKAGELAEFDASWRLLAGEWLKVDHFSVKGGRLDLAKRRVSMKDVLAKGAQGLFRRAAGGQIDWLQTPALRVTSHPLPLSAREWEIANLVARGLTNRDIAERLVVSTRTVEGHLYRMFAKLNIADREELGKLIRPDDEPAV